MILRGYDDASNPGLADVREPPHFSIGTLQEAAKIDLVKPQAHLERVIGSSGSM